MHGLLGDRLPVNREITDVARDAIGPRYARTSPGSRRTQFEAGKWPQGARPAVQNGEVIAADVQLSENASDSDWLRGCQRPFQSWF